MAFVQIQGCAGTIAPEVLGLYTPCGVNIRDISVHLDPSWIPDTFGVNGNINTDASNCTWIPGDLTAFSGCDMQIADIGDYIPAGSFIFIQMTSTPAQNIYMEENCDVFPRSYLIKNSCQRTIDAFPFVEAGDTVRFTVSTPTTEQNITIYDRSPDYLPIIIWYNWKGMQNHGGPGGSICGSGHGGVNLSTLIQPFLSFDQVLVEEPSCTRNHGEIRIISSGPVAEYSIDGGVTWQIDSIFTDLDAGIYNLMIRDSMGACAISFDSTITIQEYKLPSFAAIWWDRQQDTGCSGENGIIYIDAGIGTFGSNGLEYSIDGGLSYSDSAVFYGLIEGTYDIIIRDKDHPECADTTFWTSGSLPHPPDIIGLARDSIGFCDNGRVEIEASGNELLYSLDGIAYHLDSIVVLVPNTNYTIYVKEVGDDQCIDSMEVVLFQATEFVPEVTINGHSAAFSLTIGSKAPYTLLWSNGDTTTMVDNLPSGFNYLDITDGWGCSQRFAFFIEDNACVFQLTDSIVDATCETPTTSIYLLSHDSVNQYTYDWSIDRFDGLPFIENVDHGTFYVDVSYGVCTKRIMFTTPVGGIESVDYETEPTKCDGSLGVFFLNKIYGGQGPYQIDITGEQFDSNLTIIDLDQGWYSYTIMDTMGCLYRDSFEILVEADIPTLDLLTSFDCATRLYTLDLSSIQGGTPPYEVRLNQSLTDQDIIEDISPGNYEIEIVDSSRCSSGIIPIQLVGEASISINSDTALQIGDELALQAIGDLSLLNNYFWTGPDDLLCDCSRYTIRPDQAGTYTFHYGTQDGCERDLTFYVDILQTNVFIPNSFTPNGDNVNDLFEIFSPNHEVITLQIYNRWGDKIYSDQGPDFRWNGQIGNNKAEQGVYIYHVVLKGANGRTQQESGSITLIR